MFLLMLFVLSFIIWKLLYCFPIRVFLCLKSKVSNSHIVASKYEKFIYAVVSVTVLLSVKVISSIYMCAMKTFFVEELCIGRFRTYTRLAGLRKFTEFFSEVGILGNIRQN
jgi:hypothetical protein